MAGQAAEQEEPIMRKSTKFIGATVRPGGRGSCPYGVVGPDSGVTSQRSAASMRQL